jgi:hypothetical protein
VATVTTIRIFTTANRQAATVRFRYDPRVVDLLKCLPASRRSYDPAGKVWHLLDPDAIAWFARAARRAGHTVDDDSQPAAAAPARPTDWATGLFTALGPDYTKPAYRALSKVLHPDHGGSAELQRDLTAAYERSRFAGRDAA